MSRRSQGLGRILKRVAKDGTISWRLGWELPTAAEIDPNTGKPRRQYGYKTVRVNTKKEAQAELEKIKASLREGSYVVPARATFGQACEEWLQSWLDLHKVRGNTFDGYAMRLRSYVIPRIGQMEAQRLTTAHFQELYNYLLREGSTQRKVSDAEDAAQAALSPKTVIAVHRNVKQVVHMLIKQKRLAIDPTLNVELPRAVGDSDAQDEDAGGVIHPLDEKQLDSLLNGFAGHQFEAFVKVAAATGARRGELMALRWCDMGENQIRIERGLVDSGKNAKKRLSFARPKNKRSRRAIELDAGTVAYLDSYWRRQAETALALGRPMKRGSESLVFPLSLEYPELPMDPRQVSKIIGRKGRALGFASFVLKDLRHTHATLLLKRGVNVKVVSERLGHANVSTTLNIYAHVLPGMQGDAARVMGEILGGA